MPPPPAAANNRFAADLYARVRAGDGSRFVSPLSVHAAFALLSAGARGDTRDEIARVLHLPADPDGALAVGDLGQGYAAGDKPYELNVANSLWGQAGYPWAPAFLAAGGRFGAAVRSAVFRTDPEAGRRTVNRWVKGHTRDRVKTLLPAGSVTPLTRLILANAVSFKGRWADPFHPFETRDQPFTRADGSSVAVPLMARRGGYRHARLRGFQVLELPYAGGELAMLVALPADHRGLPAVEAKLGKLDGWLGAMTDEPLVEVWLPRFRVDHQLALPAVLTALGMAKAFDPDAADLSGLVTHLPEDRLSVTDAFHRAFVEVTEEGTEAAAVSGAVVGVRSVRREPEPVVFRADRPFLFLIRDVRQGTILFVGRFAGPG